MTILVMASRPITTLANGYDLRVWNLCRVLAQADQLVLLYLPLPGSAPAASIPPPAELDVHSVFCQIVASPAPEDERPSWRRHLRFSEDRFFEWGHPVFYRATVACLRTLCAQHSVQKIVAFGGELAGLLKPFRKECRILIDVCDSMALRIERERKSNRNVDRSADRSAEKNTAGPKRRSDLSGYLKSALAQQRWNNVEKMLPHWFEQVMTINPNDSRKIEQLSGASANVSTLPNGVAADVGEELAQPGNQRRGVAFWGNLAFSPNRDAVRYFYEKVYLPYLQPAGIELCLVGADPEPWLVAAASQDPGIRLTGFVRDLPALLREYPIMVNPMRIGSGMKNKVLEAFLIGLVVVSTSLGIESIEGAASGEHYLLADTPAAFNQAILALLDDAGLRDRMVGQARNKVVAQYTWEIVGRRLHKLIEGM